MNPFDLLNVPLDGVNLIEASAGTGKTYSIEGLFVRLILELQLEVDQILVLTFTNAATEELKDRIRRKLVQSRRGFEGQATDDPLVAELVMKYPDAKASETLLHDALIDFDKAAIFTIHGFCQRILHENAFETLSLFDTELITNQNHLVRGVVDDFWRKTFYQLPRELIGYLLTKITGPEYFRGLFERTNKPGVKIIPDWSEPVLESLPRFRNRLKELKRCWPPAKEKVVQALKDTALSAVVYGSQKPAEHDSALTQRDLRVGLLIEAMDRLTDPLSIGFPLFDNFERLTTAKLTQSTKKDQTTPRHRIFDLCQALFELQRQLAAEMEAYLVYLKSRFLAFARSALSDRKKMENVQYFDDLLVLLFQALQHDDEQVLARAIRQKYKAALVDEFQDTDDIQYGILRQLFSHPDSLLFMIGDPKQAIYSFRGADIFSYMKAAESAAARYTLLKNWRSQPDLITAVNTIFANNKVPFVYDEIPFEKGTSARPKAADDNDGDAPMMLWYLDSDRFSSNDKLINKTDAVQLIAEAVGGEIRNLVAGRKSFKPGEIAVLVRTNDQAQLIKDALSLKNVPAVLYSTGNIFDSREASEVEKILTAIADPGRIPHVKAALATEIMGLQAGDLISDDFESRWWENRLSRFRTYHQIWSHYGFVRMFRKFLSEENIRQRLLSLTAGERRLTNVLHLVEILHRQATDKTTGMVDLIKWLSEQRDPAAPRLEEHQLRLENDQKAVKIVTIHKSKGLEYPVVFCPFGWENSLVRKKDAFIFHDIDRDRRLTLDLGSDRIDSHVGMAQNELLSENLRLLYVALTRARDKCYLVWGRINTAETSALAYLLHCDMDLHPHTATEDLTQVAGAQFMARSNSEFIEDLRRLAEKSRNSIRVEPLPAESDAAGPVALLPEAEITLFSRNFGGRIDYSWRIASFSSLVSKGVPDIDSPDRDIALNPIGPDLTIPSDESVTETPMGAHDIFAFPRGTRAGIFFHDVMEHHDFAAQNPADLSELVAKKLKHYGFDPTWRDVVNRLLTDTLSIALHPDLPQLKLASVAMSQRVNEMEFYFPLNPISSEGLAKVFGQCCLSENLIDFSLHLEKLDFAPARGFLKGYIDLVFQHQGRFYLVDWKSNFLGSDYKHYHKDSLIQVMQADLYTLQYHLYTMALHQYLRLRKPDYSYEKDFGGIFYIFLRGVDASLGAEYGIYYDLPDPNLIRSIGETLIPEYHE
jgi:exodeoxyribonuclease V beta subunit